MSASERQAEIARLTAAAKAALDRHGLTRTALVMILDNLQRTAALIHLWSETDYPLTAEDNGDGLHLVAEEPDRSFAIYVNVLRPGRRVPPHNHTTWACVAAIHGCEYNYLYDRLDDGRSPGRAQLRQSAQIRVIPGTGLTLMPDDIHAIANEGDAIVRHLHFYGRSLETLTDRLAFDLKTNSCKVMPIYVAARR